MRTINDAGRELVERFEELRLEAYLDAHTPPIPTIGYGHTGPDVHLGQRITETEAVGLLEQDLADAERTVTAAVKVPLTDNQFSALVSASFNIGPSLFHHADGSPTTILRDLNAGALQAAADQLLRWDRSGGRVLNGLDRRRRAERELFLS